jgi:hypothetical protein
MKRLISIALLVSTPLWPAACTLTATATLSASATHWSGTGCTGGSFVPGNGDTVTISGYKLTVDQDWTIGASGATGSVAIATNATGTLEVASGVTLTVRGDVIHTGDINNADMLTMDAGSHFVFDSSQASNPTTTYYRWGTSTSGSIPHFVANGTSGSHVTVTSSTANGALGGQFGIPASSQFGYACVVATYTDFSNLGGSTTPAFLFGDSNPYLPYLSIINSTFTNVGRMTKTAASGNYSFGWSSTFLLDHDTFTNSPGWTNFGLTGITRPLTPGGVGQITNNVFDKRFSDGDGNCNNTTSLDGWTVTGNYFGSTTCNLSSVPTIIDNFIRVAAHQELNVQPTTAGGYYFWDSVDDNPHWTTYAANLATTMSGFVFEMPDDITGDSGEMFAPGLGASVVTQAFSNNILAPSKTGRSVSEISATTALMSTNALLNVNHNTWVGATAIGAFGMLQTNEAGASTFPFHAAESNLAWSNGGGYYKVGVIQYGRLLQDSVTTADYNSSDSNVLLTDPSCSGCTNQGKGYAGKWTATPGAHDVTASPYFADQYRNVALWDTKYLGKAAGAAWQTSHAYAVGDLVSDSHAGYWGGATVNFRCIAAHTSGSTTEPNVGASWRTDWEWESLNDIQAATVAGTTYTDGAIGCAGCTAIQALVKWVQRGFTPQNPALWCAGHDGETIGAVPFCAKGRAMIGTMGPSAGM